jgi:biopolymer transport protein ExbD
MPTPPIKFRCPSCEQGYTVAIEKAGSKIKCQKCGAKVRIPDAPTAKSKKKQSTGDSPTKRTGDTPAKKSSGKKPSVTPKLEAALDSLFDDDDDMFQDDDVGATVGPNDDAGEVRLEVADDDEQAVDVGNVRLEPADDDDDGVTVRLEPDDSKDDLAAVQKSPNATDPKKPEISALPSDLEEDDEDEEEDGLSMRSHGGDDEELDLTPMVDVTFLLLIFFMITASFTIQKTMQVPPPNPDEEGASMSPVVQDPEDDMVRVEIDQRNLITIDDDPLPDIDRLVDFLRAAGKPEILITAHEDALHETVVTVLDAANEVDMQRIRLGITKN